MDEKTYFVYVRVAVEWRMCIHTATLKKSFSKSRSCGVIHSHISARYLTALTDVYQRAGVRSPSGCATTVIGWVAPHCLRRMVGILVNVRQTYKELHDLAQDIRTSTPSS